MRSFVTIALIITDLGPLDPSKASVYAAVRDIFEETAELFPSKMFHVGGDEVDFACWDSNPDIAKYGLFSLLSFFPPIWYETCGVGRTVPETRELVTSKRRLYTNIHVFSFSVARFRSLRFMEDLNITSSRALQTYYMNKILDMTSDMGKRTFVWQEVFDNGGNLRKDAIVHVWKNGADFHDEVMNVTAAGKYQKRRCDCCGLAAILTSWMRCICCRLPRRGVIALVP